jgi:hypothetical protein
MSILELVFEHTFTGITQGYFHIANHTVGNAEAMKCESTNRARINVVNRARLPVLPPLSPLQLLLLLEVHAEIIRRAFKEMVDRFTVMTAEAMEKW